MNWNVVLLISFFVAFLWLNYKYSNVFVKVYNYCTGLPKMFVIFVVIILLFAPALLKNNMVIDYFRDYLPDSINKKIDTVNQLRQLSIPTNKSLEGGQNFINSNNQKILTKQKRKVPDSIKKHVAASQNWKCKACGNLLDASYEADHTIALEDNGTNDISNLQVLCRNCHGKKTSTDNIKRRYNQWIK